MNDSHNPPAFTRPKLALTVALVAAIGALAFNSPSQSSEPVTPASQLQTLDDGEGHGDWVFVAGTSRADVVTDKVTGRRYLVVIPNGGGHVVVTEIQPKVAP